VPLQAAVHAHTTVKSLGVPVKYHEFDAGHEINLEMLEVARNFIVNTLV
jgi:phospholipase/carboxylesterase